jgi:tRNA(Ile)-lysidine synthase TilS/MesJ
LTNAGDAQHLIVAFSGGADSVLTAHFAAATGLPLTLWYLHHYGTPIEAHRQNVFTQMQARYSKMRMLTDNADISTLSRRMGYSWEHTASLVRRKRLLQLRASTPGAAVATGHHYSDYLETLALRRERKIPEAFLPALSDRDEATGFLRPLFQMTREEVRVQVDKLGLPYFEDPANEDMQFARNRVRKTPKRSPEDGSRPLTPAIPLFSNELTRELRLPLSDWSPLSETEKARSLFSAFRRLAVVRKFTRGHFSRAHKLPFALPPFFAHLENSGSEQSVIFRRGLGENVSLPGVGTYIRGDAVTRSVAIRQPYGKKSVAKIFSEKKLSPRQRRQTLVYLDPDVPKLAARIIFPDRTELSAHPL